MCYTIFISTKVINKEKSMNKKFLIVACFVVATVAFSGCSLSGEDKNKEEAKENSKEVSKTEQNQKSDKSDNTDGNYFETMSDLMARGKNMKCTYTQKVDGENTADGVVYMADKNVRVEITANKGTAREGKMYSITDHEWSYSWTEGSPKGFKMTLEATELDKKQKESVSNMAKEIDFKCKPWKKDNSKFKVPSNIEFEDMSELAKSLGDIDLGKEVENAKTQGDAFICNICKTVPVEGQAECLGDVVCDWSK